MGGVNKLMIKIRQWEIGGKIRQCEIGGNKLWSDWINNNNIFHSSVTSRYNRSRTSSPVQLFPGSALLGWRAVGRDTSSTTADRLSRMGTCLYSFVSKLYQICQHSICIKIVCIHLYQYCIKFVCIQFVSKLYQICQHSICIKIVSNLSAFICIDIVSNMHQNSYQN
jgi:hypothetical protein